MNPFNSRIQTSVLNFDCIYNNGRAKSGYSIIVDSGSLRMLINFVDLLVDWILALLYTANKNYYRLKLFRESSHVNTQYH